MKRRQRSCLLVMSAALLLCSFQQASGSGTALGSSASPATPSEVRGQDHLGAPAKQQTAAQSEHNLGGHRHHSRLGQKPRPDKRVDTGHGNITTVTSKTSERLDWSQEDGVSPLCAYQVIEGGVGGPLCFRHNTLEYTCPQEDCRRIVSSGMLVAHIHRNSTVLLHWMHKDRSPTGMEMKGTISGHQMVEDLGGRSNVEEASMSGTLSSGRYVRKPGYELLCWWNGSYTQFECTSIYLGSSCVDFILTGLHENIPYRICLRSRSPGATQRSDQGDCVEFTLPSTGMQDIVIAMTTVGGVICVMLVIICLLVAYITENIMSPTTPHTYSYRSHPRY